jgi:hypothetical protein
MCSSIALNQSISHRTAAFNQFLLSNHCAVRLSDNQTTVTTNKMSSLSPSCAFDETIQEKQQQALIMSLGSKAPRILGSSEFSIMHPATFSQSKYDTTQQANPQTWNPINVEFSFIDDNSVDHLLQ